MSYAGKQSKPDSAPTRKVTNTAVAAAFADQRASTAVQLKQQNIMHTAHSPNVIQQMTAEEEPIQGEFDSDAPAQLQDAPAAKPNNTGLPNQLKSGIESLSGISMDNVKVHYNSDKPAQLNAHAYAQGSEIHVAPGQEQHLPHEAWHVVQQARGHVKPTIQMKAGVPINNDVGLENEADVMGEKALSLDDSVAQAALLENATQHQLTSAGVVQREVKCFRDETGKKHMDTLAGELNSSVGNAKTIVDANPLLLDVSKREEGYLGAWVTCFNEYLTSGEIPAFFYARYGYAIETLATLFFKSQDHLGYKVETQATYGATRPDFVIKSGSSDVAWIDITSSASVGHIFSKDGGGWSSRPYVAEILYDMPDPAAFTVTAKAKLTSEQLALLEKADKSRALRVQQFDTGMKQMGVILGNAYAAAFAKKGSALSKADVKEVTAATCQFYLDKFVDGGVKPLGYIGVLASIDALEVAGEVSSGVNWARWAFGKLGDQALGRSLLLSLGRPKED